jgi:peroxiredoxin
MMEPSAPTPAGQHLSRGQVVFVTVLLLIGVAFLGLAAQRTLYPAAPAKQDLNLAREAQADLDRRGYRPLSEPLDRLLHDSAYQPVPTQVHPLLGQPAPEFNLETVEGLPWRLSEQLKTGPVVLVFYYGYHCNHCVSQLFGLHKDIGKFRELGASVVAVSADPPELTRKRFVEYGPFAFPVVSDPENRVAEAYGVYRRRPDTPKGELLHGTFLITRRGKVAWANSGDEPFTENQTLLIELARSEGRLPGP